MPSILTFIYGCFDNPEVTATPFEPRYRAVASWSRVQGAGVPLMTVVEIVLIWLLSLVLAMPEAVGFKMVTFEYRNVNTTTCMLQADSRFMTVSVYGAWIRVCVCGHVCVYVNVLTAPVN